MERFADRVGTSGSAASLLLPDGRKVSTLGQAPSVLAYRFPLCGWESPGVGERELAVLTDRLRGTPPEQEPTSVKGIRLVGRAPSRLTRCVTEVIAAGGVLSCPGRAASQ
jgi:hypothetical protein